MSPAPAELGCSSHALVWQSTIYLHGYFLVVNLDFLGQEVGPNRRFVLLGELLLNVLVHQRCLADTAQSQGRRGCQRKRSAGYDPIRESCQGSPAVTKDDDLQ